LISVEDQIAIYEKYLPDENRAVDEDTSDTSDSKAADDDESKAED
jgi:hypothetical protein